MSTLIYFALEPTGSITFKSSGDLVINPGTIECSIDEREVMASLESFKDWTSDEVHFVPFEVAGRKFLAMEIGSTLYFINFGQFKEHVRLACVRD